MKRGFSTYKQINTMGLSQLDLILTVYRGAIGLLSQAQSDFEQGKMNDGRTACDRARKCIVHLYTTLNMEKGEAIAVQLGQLYAFMIQQIDLAVASKSCKLLGDVKSILGTIKEAWEGLKDRETVPASADPIKMRGSQAEGEKTKEPSPLPSSNRQRLTISA